MRVFHRHVQHFGDVLALVLDFQRLAVVALAVADVARHVHVRQEVHLDLDHAVALAGFAAAALDVEREASGRVAAFLRSRHCREQIADRREEPRVGRRIGARRAADRRLVDGDDLVEMLEAADRFMRRRFRLRAVQMARGGVVQRVVDQRRLAGAGNAGHAGQQADRQFERDVLQVVAGGAGDRRAAVSDSALCACSARQSAERAVQILRGQRFLALQDVLRACPAAIDLAAVHAGAEAHVDHVIGAADRVLVVLDDDHAVADVAQMLQRVDQAVVVALVQADRRLVEHVHHAGQAGADLRCEADALRFAAGQRIGAAVERQVVEADVVEELQARDDFLDDASAISFFEPVSFSVSKNSSVSRSGVAATS